MVKNTKDTLRDELIYPIVGTKYTEESAQSLLRESVVGTAIRLVEEPDNAYDPNAVAVYIKARRVGYIPNRGMTCTACVKTVLSADNGICPKCKKADNVVKGGAATRLKLSKAIVKGYRSWLSSNPVIEEKPAELFLAKIVLKEPIDSVFVY